jgi:hypothetical protein
MEQRLWALSSNMVLVCVGFEIATLPLAAQCLSLLVSVRGVVVAVDSRSTQGPFVGMH